MKSDYHERRARIMERLAERALRQKNESKRLFEKSSDMASVIPFGQPILVGHHSEKRDRNYREKIHNTMGASVRAQQKAEYYESRLESMETNSAISSDDPDALVKLKEKLERLENLQTFMKECNKIINSKKLSDQQKVEKLVASHHSIDEAKARELLSPDFCNRVGFPSYRLTNNNGNMARIKERIKMLEKMATMKTEETVIQDVRIVTSVEDNRVQIFFPRIPSDDIRKELNSHGFRWAPSIKAWVRHLNDYATYLAKQIVTKYYSPKQDDQPCDSCGA